MSYSLGVDVGTTFTAAAMWRDGRVEVVSLETHRVTVPSVVFADGDTTLFGTAAAARGVTQPAGMAREFKRRLGDSVPIMLSGAPHSADRLVALFVRWVVDSVSEQLGERPANIVVTHPANWTEFQLNLLTGALGNVGLGDVGVLSEPQAAAHDFGTAAHLAEGQVVLVYDLGGGTFDVALLRKDGIGFRHIGETAGVERLGGIDFDEAVFQHVVSHVPAEAISGARSDATGRMALAQLRRACVEAKESLSSEVAVEIPIVLPGHSSTVRLTRAEFENMIRPMLRQTIDLSRQILVSAALTADELSAILLVGGSSRIPLISEMVRQETGATVRVDAHPKLVVARGAGRWAGEQMPAVRPATTSTGSRRWRPFAVVGAIGALAAAAVAGAVLIGGDGENAEDTVPSSAVETVPPSAPTTSVSAGTTSAVTGSTAAPNGATGDIASGRWSADGSRLFLGRDDGSIRVLDVLSGETVGTFTGHTGPVRDLLFHTDRLATASDDATVRVWDVGTADEQEVLRGHTGPVTILRWNPDGTRIASGSEDGTARIFDVETGETVATIPGQGGPITLIAWSRDGAQVVTGGDDNVARIWDAATGDLEDELDEHTGRIIDLNLSPAGDLVLTTSEDGTARVWDRATGDPQVTLRGHEGAVVDAGWGPGADTILTASLDGTARIWDATTGDSIQTFGEVGDPGVATVAWSRDGSQMSTGSVDGMVRIWEAGSGDLHVGLPGHTDVVTAIQWTEQGRIASNSDDGTARVWDAATGEELFVLSD